MILDRVLPMHTRGCENRRAGDAGDESAEPTRPYRLMKRVELSGDPWRRGAPFVFIVFLFAAALLLGGGLTACKRADPGASAEPLASRSEGEGEARGATAPPADAIDPTRVEDAVVWSSGGAASDAPLVVALHGMGDRPEAFMRLYQGFGRPARFVFPRAPTPRGGGFSWFPYRAGMGEKELAQAIEQAADRLWARLARGAGEAATHPKRLVVTGFSQGGILSFALAAKHPDAVACAVPVAGALPPPLWPKGRPAKTFSLHGTADGVVPFAEAQRTVSAFQRAEGDAELQPFEGLGHSVSSPLQDALYARLAECLERS